MVGTVCLFIFISPFMLMNGRIVGKNKMEGDDLFLVSFLEGGREGVIING